MELFWKDKNRIITKFHRTDLVMYSHSKEEKKSCLITNEIRYKILPLED